MASVAAIMNVYEMSLADLQSAYAGYVTKINNRFDISQTW
jgi:hypothetical protein